MTQHVIISDNFDIHTVFSCHSMVHSSQGLPTLYNYNQLYAVEVFILFYFIAIDIDIDGN